MTFAELLTKYNMNRKQISDRFRIPYRTVQNWCADGKENYRPCPEYIILMIDEILSRE